MLPYLSTAWMSQKSIQKARVIIKGKISRIIMGKGVWAGGKYSTEPMTSHDKWVVIKFMFRQHQAGDNAIRHGNTRPLMSPHCIFMSVAFLRSLPPWTWAWKYLQLKLELSIGLLRRLLLFLFVVLQQLHCKSAAQDWLLWSAVQL